MKKFITSLIVAIFVATGISYAYSDHIVPKNNEEATKSKGYPVIELKNTTNKDLLVEYDFYINEAKYEKFDGEIMVPANSTKTLEVPQLKVLGKTGETKRIWFHWTEPDKLKPQEAQIDTIIFRSPEIPPMELGFNF